MLYSLGYIFRRPDLSRDQFRQHYENNHTRLAHRLLPEFTHYVRNHVVDSAGPMASPDAVSEFGFAGATDWSTALAVLGDARGSALKEDELRFMDKPRNQGFAVSRWEWLDPATPPTTTHKYIVWFGSAVAVSTQPAILLQRMRTLDPALRRATLCLPSDFSVTSPRPCWLCYSAQRPEPAALCEKYNNEALPLLCCASVEEAVGYPGTD